MDATTFRAEMEAFGRKMNIPLRDLLHDIEEIGLYSQTLPEEERSGYFLRATFVYYKGFPVPLPVGTKSLRLREAEAAEDSDN